MLNFDAFLISVPAEVRFIKNVDKRRSVRGQTPPAGADEKRRFLATGGKGFVPWPSASVVLGQLYAIAHPRFVTSILYSAISIAMIASDNRY
jgi:hypothetical protein